MSQNVGDGGGGCVGDDCHARAARPRPLRPTDHAPLYDSEAFYIIQNHSASHPTQFQNQITTNPAGGGIGGAVAGNDE